MIGDSVLDKLSPGLTLQLKCTKVLQWNLDALNTSLLIDNFMEDGLKDMAPYKSALNLEAVREISSDMIIPKPVVSITSAYMSKAPEPVITPRQNEFMRQVQL